MKTRGKSRENTRANQVRPGGVSLACAALVLLCTLALNSCRQKDSSPVLATVGHQQITIRDLQREVERRVAARRPVPDKESLVQELVLYEACLQRAHHAKLDQDPEIQREINNLLVAKLRDRELAARWAAISVSDAEVKAEYAGDPLKYTRPAKARLAILFQGITPVMSEASRAEARARLMTARQKFSEQPAPSLHEPAGLGFGALAIEYSEEQTSRYRGGDIGWFDVPAKDLNTVGSPPLLSRWPRAVLEMGFALNKGQVSDVIETDLGFYVVMRTDFRESVTIPLEQTAATIQQRLLAEKRREAEEAFRQETLELTGAKIHQAALASVKLSLPATPIARNKQSGPPGFPSGQAMEGN